MINRIVNALGICEGGGQTYLDILSNSFDDANCIFFIDLRLKNKIQEPKLSKVIYISQSLKGRFKFSLFRLYLIWEKDIWLMHTIITNKQIFIFILLYITKSSVSFFKLENSTI